MFSTPTLHHYMESCIIIQHYAILSGIAIGKQAVFTKTQAVNIIYILRKNFKQISLIYWNVFNFFADRKYLAQNSGYKAIHCPGSINSHSPGIFDVFFIFCQAKP